MLNLASALVSQPRKRLPAFAGQWLWQVILPDVLAGLAALLCVAMFAISPARAQPGPNSGWLWGAGPIVQLPVITNKTLRSNVSGGGPDAVLVYMREPLEYDRLRLPLSFSIGAHGNVLNSESRAAWQFKT